jgi:hypothetical protein
MKYIEKVNMKSCARLNEGVWLLACLVILFLCLPLDVFSTTLCTRLGFSHLFVLGCHTSFVTSLWILWGYMFFVVHMVGRGWCHMMLWKSFHDHCERCKVSCLAPVDPCPFAHALVFTSLNWHCVINQWCFAHWQILSSLTPFKLIWFHELFFSRGYSDNCDSSHK